MRIEGQKMESRFLLSSPALQREEEAAKPQEGGKEATLRVSALLDPEKVEEFGKVLKSLFEVFNLELHFTIHRPTGEVIARIVNRETGEVIREIPPEKFLDMIAKLQELAGILVDEVV